MKPIDPVGMHGRTIEVVRHPFGGFDVILVGFRLGSVLIASGDTEREALGNAYEFLTAAAAAVLVRR